MEESSKSQQTCEGTFSERFRVAAAPELAARQAVQAGVVNTVADALVRMEDPKSPMLMIVGDLPSYIEDAIGAIGLETNRVSMGLIVCRKGMLHPDQD